MKRIIVAALTLLSLASCSKQDREITIINQETAIDSYITKQFPDNRLIRNNGSNRIVLVEGTSEDSVAIGDSLTFYYAGHIFSSGPGVLFATNREEVAIASSFSTTDSNFAPMKVILKENSFTDGLRNGMIGMKEGEYSYIIFSAKYGFNNTQLYNIPKLSPLLYQVWIEKIKKI